MSGIRFDFEGIRVLAAILTETGLTEIEVAEKESRIRVVRSPAPIAYVPSTTPAQATASAETASVPAIGTAPADASKHPGAVLSPMVGIAYLAEEPGSPPYVALGQAVAAGQTLLLIEAMKTYNQIKAPRAGVVAQILIASGAPVEYGEVLMVLE